MVSPELIARFNAKWKRNADSGCWEWTASLMGRGYGQIKIPGQRRQIPAHRLSYLIHKGEIPVDRQVMHRCDNPRCVNPEHLLIGTCAENQQDMKQKGRSTRGERNTQAILTEAKVRAMKAMLSAGEISQAEIARMFEISPMEVSRIKRGLRWAHVK